MSIWLYTMIGIFCLMGAIAIFNAYRPVWKRLRRQNIRVQKESKAVGEYLKILQEGQNAVVKADAFVTLMQLSYVLVHTIINQGNNYDDKKQTREFCKSLTPQLISNLNTMEGKYE